MLGRTGCRMAAKLHTSELFRQINPFPMRNWRAHQAEKLAPNVKAGKKAVHDQNVEVYELCYNALPGNKFPYPSLSHVSGWLIDTWLPGNLLQSSRHTSPLSKERHNAVCR
ncbi:hypothetical protein DIPPA_34273 [Diplonema papillatum]|nr:hypothetical protein DIPPA_34273 [Diplonema papillatum]